MNDEVPEVPIGVIQKVGNMMDQTISEAKLGREYITDDAIKTTPQLVVALKAGHIPGSAHIEWHDEKGRLRANVIDFLIESRVKATDPDNGDTVVVNSDKILDGTWKVLY
jgi:Cft2 family RNA processing exonuclease